MFRIGNITTSHARAWVANAAHGRDVLAPGDQLELDVPGGTKVELRRILDDAVIGVATLPATPPPAVTWISANAPAAPARAELPPPLPGIPKPPAVLNARGELPVWQDYVTVAIKQIPAQEDDLLFNTRECPIRRGVTISASFMIWSPTRDPVLRGYDGVEVLDLAELELVADHIVIAAPLRFPGTNVTIRCRTLEFQADGAHSGSIDTTPLDFPVGVPAYTSTRWSNSQDADDHTTYPGVVDATGAAVRALAGQGGAPGQGAGTITLEVKEILFPVNPGKMFIGHGGRGEEGEPGGLEPRAKGDTMPATLTRRDLSAAVKTFKVSGSVSSWRWPSAMYGLTDPNIGPTNVGYARVLFIDDVGFEDDANEFVLGTSYCKYTLAGDDDPPDDFWNRRGDSAHTPHPPTYPAGPAAYPGGAPGRSGAGADVRFNLATVGRFTPRIE
ncbi:hypothetical protein ACPW96_15005 [Micromonospora sp. DT81.3]|uniref:hypothetical protein n=1 Tax=Micromonospora sp. DT81.3 TaxID=3416523 RepID=UPI003CF9EA6F